MNIRNAPIHPFFSRENVMSKKPAPLSAHQATPCVPHSMSQDSIMKHTFVASALAAAALALGGAAQADTPTSGWTGTLQPTACINKTLPTTPGVITGSCPSGTAGTDGVGVQSPNTMECLHSPRIVYSATPGECTIGPYDAPTYGNQDKPAYGNLTGVNVKKAANTYIGGIAVTELDGSGGGIVYTWGWNYYGTLGIGMDAGGLPAKGTAASSISTAAWARLDYSGGYKQVDFFTNPKKYDNFYTTNTNLKALKIGKELTEPTRIIDVDAGYRYVVALDEKYRVWAWGENDAKQVGRAQGASYNFPQRVNLSAAGLADGTKIKKVAASHGYLYYGQGFALTEAGDLYTWGGNLVSKRGLGSSSATAPAKVTFPGGTKIVDIQSGDYRNLALDDQGNVWVWGHGTGGTLGQGLTNQTDAYTPAKISRDATTITLGTNGRAIGTFPPTQVTTTMGKPIAISVSYDNCLILDENKDIWQWGIVFLGGGTGSAAYATVPFKVIIEPREITRIGYTPTPQQIIAGESVSYFIDQFGRSWAWGSNRYFGLGREGGYETSNDLITIAAHQLPEIIGDGDTQIYDSGTKTPADGLTKSAQFGTYGFNALHPTIYDEKYNQAGDSTYALFKSLAFHPIPKIKQLGSSRSGYTIVDVDGNLFKWINDGSAGLAWGNGDVFNKKYDFTGNARDGLYDAYAYEVLLMWGGIVPPTPPCVPEPSANVNTSSSASSVGGSSTQVNDYSMVYAVIRNYDTSSSVGGIGSWTGTLYAYAGDDLTKSLWAAEKKPSRANDNSIFTADATNRQGVSLSGLALPDPSGITGDDKTELKKLPLGQIVNSQLVYVSKPTLLSLDDGYLAFAKAVNANGSAPNKYRKGVVYVIANDNMLHGFDAGRGSPKDTNGNSSTSPNDVGSGKEVFAYIPRGLLDNISAFQSDYSGQTWTDGGVFSGDAQLDINSYGISSGIYGNNDSKNWATVLAGTLGGSAPGYFVLDVTKPDDIPTLPPSKLKSVVLADQTYSPAATAAKSSCMVSPSAQCDPACNPATTCTDPNDPATCTTPNVPSRCTDASYKWTYDPAWNPGAAPDDIGYQFSPPVMDQYNLIRQSAQIVRINTQTVDGEWAVIMGNGYNNLSGLPVLLIQSLTAAGHPLYTVAATCYANGAEFKPDPANPSAATPCQSAGNGLSAPRPVDVDGNGTADFVYAGDLMGNLWKFDISNVDRKQWKVTYGGQPMFTAVGPTGKAQPITSAPVAVAYPSGGFMVGFGTGKNIAQADLSDQNQNSFYALHDGQALTVATTEVVHAQGSKPAVHASVVSLDQNVSTICPPSSASIKRSDYASCLYQRTGGELFTAVSTPVNGAIALSSSPAPAEHLNWSASGATVLGWYYDIPEIINGHAAKVLDNPAMMSDNVVQFFSVNAPSLGQLGDKCTTDAVANQDEWLAFNYFHLFTGAPVDNITITIGGVPTTYSATSGKGQKNRILFGVGKSVRTGTDGFKRVLTNDKIDHTPKNTAGKRAGWRISR